MDETQVSNHHDGLEGGAEAASEETTFPRATLTRMMHQQMRRNSKIPVDAKEAMDRCVTEFAGIVMRAAMHECRRDRRWTVTGEDLIFGMSNLGFDDYVGPLTEYLRRYRESEGVVPRGRQTGLMALQQLSAPAAAEEEAPPPPSPDLLTLQLAPPSVRDVTELGFDTDVYAVWRAARAPPPAAAGTSRMPPPTPAADE